MSEEIAAVTREDCIAECKALGDKLASIYEEPVTRITIHEFEARVVPILKRYDAGNFLQEYLPYIEHPLIRLEVLDGHGNVIYEIPPLLAEQKTPDRAPSRMSSFANDYAMLHASNPRGTENKMLSLLSRCSDKNYDGRTDAINMAVKLNVIFKDYGIELLPIPKDHVEPTANVDAKAETFTELNQWGIDEI